ncbi:MAG: hypothetical protein R3A52_25330 [Polyangiales bacterium]
MRPAALAAAAALALATASAGGWPEPRCATTSTGVGHLPEASPDGFEEVELPGDATTGLAALPSGGFAVGVSGPSGVAFLDARGEAVGVARADTIVDRGLLVSAAGRVFGASSSQLCAFARDATLRVCTRVSFGSSAAPTLLADAGLATVIDRLNDEATLTLFDAEGEARGALTFRRDRDQAATEAVATPDGGAVFAISEVLHFVSRDFAVRRARALGEVRALAATPRGIAYATDDALVLADRDGVARARAELPSPARGLTALSDGRVAVLTAATGVEVTLFSDAGERLGAISVPGRDEVDVRAADEGAVLVTSDEGVIARLDADGTTRWRVQVPHGRLRPPALPMRGGGLIVATTGRRLLRLRPRGPHGDAH